MVPRVGCWEWTASFNQHGYGQVGNCGRPIGAHRVAWFLHSGKLTPGLRVLHKCDNPQCSNPDHLYEGTQAQNMLDKKQRRRDRWQDGRYKGSKIPTPVIQAIRLLHPTYTYEELGEMFKISWSAVGMIINRKIHNEVI